MRRRYPKKKGYVLMLVILMTTAVSILILGLVTVSYYNTQKLANMRISDNERVALENEANEYLYTDVDFTASFAAISEGESIENISFGNGLLTVSVQKVSDKMVITSWRYKG